MLSSYCRKNQYPSCSTNQYPIDLKVKDNNIRLKIERLFNYVINDKIELCEELTNNEKEQFECLLVNLEFNYSKESIKCLSTENKTMVKYIVYFLSNIIKSKQIIPQNNITRQSLIYVYNKCRKNQIKYFNTISKINNFYEYFYKSALFEINTTKKEGGFIDKRCF